MIAIIDSHDGRLDEEQSQLPSAPSHDDEGAIVRHEDQEIQQVVDDISSSWQMSDRGREAVAAALAMRKTKHALYAHAPMVCKGEASPCAPSCQLAQAGLAPEGERCPIEIVAITEFFNRYIEELEIDVNNMVDLGLVRELAEVETQLERVANRLAQEDMIVPVAVGVDREGNPIVRPEIHKAFDIQDRLRNRKDRILDQLQATRKAKNRGKDPDFVDPSTRAAELIAKARQLREVAESMDREVVVDP